MIDEHISSFPMSRGNAHDLGNLLQTATSAIRIIDRSIVGRSEHVDQAIAGAKASIELASEMARRTLSGMLDRPASAPETNISECLAEVALIFGGAIDGAIQLEVNVAPAIPEARCDHFALQNALLNLAFNARSAIAEAGRITIQAIASANDAAVEISVADDGVGMSPQTIDCAFDPYFTTKCEGLGGIGLPMVEQFVRGAKGEIRIESELGAGTVVTMQLPAVSRKQQDREEI